MAISFPASPVANQTYSSGNITWVYSGTTWVQQVSANLFGVVIANAQPTGNINTGTVYFNTVSNTSQVYNGTSWSNLGQTTNIINGNSNINIATGNGNITTSVNGTANVFNISNTGVTLSGTATLGAISNIKITGGSNGQAVITDGTGNLSFGTISTGPTNARVTGFNLVFGQQ